MNFVEHTHPTHVLYDMHKPQSSILINCLPDSIDGQYWFSSPFKVSSAFKSNLELLSQESGPFPPNLDGHMPCIVHVNFSDGNRHVFSDIQKVLGHCCTNSNVSYSWLNSMKNKINILLNCYIITPIYPLLSQHEKIRRRTGKNRNLLKNIMNEIEEKWIYKNDLIVCSMTFFIAFWT